MGYEYQRKNLFSLIRIICCFIVIYEHSIVLTNVDFFCLNLRSYAVDIFFILSGFWVTYSYNHSEKLQEYIKKRFYKIYPDYAFVIILFAFVLAFFSSFSYKEYFTNSGLIKYLFFNLITLNFITPNLPGVFTNVETGCAVNGSLWTIKIELGFYIILPIIVYFIKKINKSKNNRSGIILGILYLLSLLFQILIPVIINQFNLPNSLDHQLPSYLTYFIVGMAYYYYWNDLYPLLNYLLIPSIVVIVILTKINIFYLNIVLIPICLVNIVMWIGVKVRAPSFLYQIHDYSYHLYLVHYPIIMILISLGFYKINWFMSFLCTLGCSFLISYFIYNKKNFKFSKGE